MSEHYPLSTELPLVPVDDILLLKSIVLQLLPKADRTNSTDGMHRFILTDSPGPEVNVGSDEIIRYLGISVGKTAVGKWRLLVSIKELSLDEEERFSGIRDLITAEWGNSRWCTVTKRTTGVEGEIIDTKRFSDGGRAFAVNQVFIDERTQLGSKEVGLLGERLLAMRSSEVA